MIKKENLIEIYCDFNSGTDDNGFFILYHNDKVLESQIDKLGLVDGNKVLLYQESDDFKVKAVLKFKHVNLLNRYAWIAYPEWETLKRKS